MEEGFSIIDDIIISFLEDEISEKDRKILENWLSTNPANKSYFKHIYKIWNTSDLLKEDENEVEKVLEKVKFQIQNKDNEPVKNATRTKIIAYYIGKWAAVIFISICTGAFMYYQFEKLKTVNTQKSTYNEVTVPMGSKSKIRLPDGTEVTLNAGSKLTYQMNYGKVLREVDFIGEGYFKVAKLKDKPFIVHTANANIKALGTEFNVKAYPDENIIETILVKGSVVVNEVFSSQNDKRFKNDKSVILKPGQKVQIFKLPANTQQALGARNLNKPIGQGTIPIEEQLNLKVEPSDIKVETSWKDKRWVLHGEDLQSLAILLSRKFNITIRLKDPELKKYKFSGIIDNETVEQVFDIIKYTIPISYTINKDEATWILNKNREKDYKEAY